MKKVKKVANPWELAYDHKNFKTYTKDQIDEMLLCELQEIFDQEEPAKTCYCGHEIETGEFCSRECAKHYFSEIT